MTLLDVSIVNVALPSIESGLGAGPSQIQWIVAGYSLAFGLSLVPAGRIGDLVGRRTMFLVGLTGFVLASAACGLATDAGALALTRVVQGLFAGVLNPQVIALIQQLFRGPARARAFGFFGMTVGVSTAIGPALGGLLVSGLGPEYGWRSVFLINVPIGMVVIPLAWRRLRGVDESAGAARAAAAADTPGRRGGGLGLDTLGLVLIAGIVLALMWPFITASEHARGLAGAPWWLVAVAAALTAVLVVWERRQDGRGRPAVLPATLVRNSGFVLGASLGSAYFAGFTGIFIVTTLYFQQGAGLPPWQAGLAQVPFALTSAVTSGRSGHWVNRMGRRVVVVGLVTMMVAVVGIVLVAELLDTQRWAVWLVSALLALAGAGSGIVISPNQALTLADVPPHASGTASGLLQTLQRLGATVGLALMTSVFFTVVGSAPVGDLSAHSRALGISMTVTVVLLGVALAIAVVDARRRTPASV
jgi:Sugar phosphate permease